jgi:cephalosporin hydroxylase
VDPMETFYQQKHANIRSLGADAEIRDLTRAWFSRVSRHRYSYHFSWLGIPVIQFPQDLIAMQEIIWSVKPDAIIETGVAHGGSLVFHASMLELMGGDGIVVGVDVEVRAHNRRLIDAHPLAKRIRLVEGSSVDGATVGHVESLLVGKTNPLVILDSNHACSHVSAELELYQRFVRSGSYILVLDTIIDDMPEEFSNGRPWGPGRGPKAAVHRFLQATDRFAIDQEYNNKLLVSVAPDGFLRCVSDP